MKEILFPYGKEKISYIFGDELCALLEPKINEYTPEAEGSELGIDGGVAVDACGSTYGVTKPHTEDLPFERGVAVGIDMRKEPFAHHGAPHHAQYAEREVAYSFGRKEEQKWTNESCVE
jgi:hypothetical protein